ncbi:putative ABC transporter ligand-binding protein [uncultured delta proteobacterium]|uniref:Putative ABC transporter ligand-binding protein n=1 Tax=uncultured delta proteobacterium TaxID=34034 RepID=A0A212KHI3_9DELT|nr:putative ABC transporter ligand-binding protein [uncultured delta proteobacterium]
MSQGITDTEIFVGNSAAVSGIFATTGDPVLAGIRAYFDMVNSGGGIDGRLLRLVHIDDGYDPRKAVEAFDALVHGKKVFALVGQFGAPVVEATLDDIRKTGIPAVYFATGAGKLYVERALTPEAGANCYPIQPLYITEGRVMAARAAATFKAKKLGVIHTADRTGSDLMQGVSLECRELRMECSGREVPTSLEGLQEAVSAIRRTGPDFLILAAPQAFFPEIAREVARQGMAVPALTTYLNGVITIAQKTDACVGGQFDIYALNWLNYDGERRQNLEDAAQWLGDYAMNGYAHCGWTGAHFFCEGMRRLAGEKPTWENFRTAMESAPLAIPFGGAVNYAGGQRMGTQEMSLTRIDLAAPIGWTEVDGLRSVDELLRSL